MKCEGRGAKDEVRRSRCESRRSKVEGAKVEGRRSKVEVRKTLEFTILRFTNYHLVD